MRNYKGRIAAMRRKVFAAVAQIAYEGDYTEALLVPVPAGVRRDPALVGGGPAAQHHHRTDRGRGADGEEHGAADPPADLRLRDPGRLPDHRRAGELHQPQSW